MFFFFFFQAEDGIRDIGVTGVQTCALPIYAIDDYVDTIAAYALANPEAEWIVGGGWSMDVFPGGVPTAAVLDRIVSDRPVFLPNRDHHSAWVNTAALERAGITADRTDPADGRIERDDRGQATGALHEGAMELVRRLVPPPTDD